MYLPTFLGAYLPTFLPITPTSTLPTYVRSDVYMYTARLAAIPSALRSSYFYLPSLPLPTLPASTDPAYLCRMCTCTNMARLAAISSTRGSL